MGIFIIDDRSRIWKIASSKIHFAKSFFINVFQISIIEIGYHRYPSSHLQISRSPNHEITNLRTFRYRGWISWRLISWRWRIWKPEFSSESKSVTRSTWPEFNSAQDSRLGSTRADRLDGAPESNKYIVLSTLIPKPIYCKSLIIILGRANPSTREPWVGGQAGIPAVTVERWRRLTPGQQFLVGVGVPGGEVVWGRS